MRQGGEEEQFWLSLPEDGLGEGAAPASSNSSPLVYGQHFDPSGSEASRSEAAEQALMRHAKVKEEQEEDQQQEQEEERDGVLEEELEEEQEEQQEEERDGIEESGCPRGTKATKATRAAKRGKKGMAPLRGQRLLKRKRKEAPPAEVAAPSSGCGCS